MFFEVVDNKFPPPSNDFFSPKIKLIKVLFPQPLLPITKILIKLDISSSSSNLIICSFPSELIKENSFPNSL
jgi:hypothetical protein